MSKSIQTLPYLFPSETMLNQSEANLSKQWYIQKQPTGECLITNEQNSRDSGLETWGPFSSNSEAIARRVGLIRAGKCQPV